VGRREADRLRDQVLELRGMAASLVSEKP
jgi:hypothetical protein